MKTPFLVSVGVFALGVLLTAAGCVQPSTRGVVPHPSHTYALSVTLPDGSPVTAEQWAIVKDAFQQQLATAGGELVDNVSLADRIIRVVYTPAADPTATGTAVVVTGQPNPAYAFNAPRGIMPVAYSSYSSGLDPAYYQFSGYNCYYD